MAFAGGMFRTTARNIVGNVSDLDRFKICSPQVIAIRSRYYVSILLKRLRVKRVAHIPRALAGLAGLSSDEPYKKYRNDFFRYWKGGNIKNGELVSTIDDLLPGTARALHHPIWILLSGNAFAKKELVRLGQEIEVGLQQHILQYDEGTGNIWLQDHSGNWRLLRYESPFVKLINRHGLDELAALMILIHAHERPGEHFGISCLFTCEMYRCLAGISRTEEFEPIFTELYTIASQLYS
ncbi:hypothetical protein SAMN03159511_0666 [Pseudomonas sp. NFACC19-2]|nr:hypothetical protein SAMN03159511_0666 [Pseudomonas sp. NFACC19-2]